MKKKISITLSDKLVQDIDLYRGGYKNRSDFIETAVRGYIKQFARRLQNGRDLGIINRDAERLNLSSPVVASKWVFSEAKVSTTIDMFSCIGADVS